MWSSIAEKWAGVLGGEHFQRNALWSILFVGVLVRVVLFGSVPYGFNQDEASLGYDAYAILNYGVDRHEVPYPVFLIGWGSGMNALSAYLAMPFIAILGLTPTAIRSVNLVSGLASLIGIYFLVKSLCSKRLALWCTLVLSVSPWHIMMSRWALESNLLPAVFLFAVLALVKGLERPKLLPLAGALFGLSLYAYGTAYFAVPIFLAATFVYLIVNRKIPWLWSAVGVAVFAVVATPIAACLWINRQHLPSTRIFGLGIPRMSTVARYENISTLFGEGALRRTGDNLSNLFSIIARQDDGLPWNSINEHGIVFSVGLGFALIGLVAAIRDVKKVNGMRSHWVMFLWLATAVALGAVQESNINRVNLLWMPLVYFVAVGLDCIAVDRFRTIALVAAYGVLFSLFCGTYFNTNRAAPPSAFFPQFGRAVAAASAAVKGDICVTTKVFMPYALVLFYERTDPHVFARTVVYEGDGEFQSVRSFDRFSFGIDRCPASTQAYIVERGEDRSIEDQGEVMFRSRVYAVVKKRVP